MSSITTNESKSTTVDLDGWFDYANKLMRSFGKKDLGMFFKGLPPGIILDVGSGCGRFGAWLEKILKQPIILIDPAPGSFGGRSVFKYPMFQTIDDYIDYDLTNESTAGAEQRVKNTIMVLNWPNSNRPHLGLKSDACICSINKQPHDDCIYCSNPYDFTSIITLLPDHVIIMFEWTGESGSDLLTSWLYHGIGIKPTADWSYINRHKLSRMYDDLKDYREVTRMTNFGKSNNMCIEYIVLWLTKTKFKLDPNSNIAKLVAKHSPKPPEPTSLNESYHSVFNTGNYDLCDLLRLITDVMGEPPQ